MKFLPKQKQQGMMLIMLVFILTLGAIGYMLHTSTPTSVKIDRDNKTADALAEAKTALIGWSVKNNIPGRLPCPEDVGLIGTPNEGSAMGSCNNSNRRIGRLPWRTLGINDIRDGNGDKLWYVISDGFRNSPINTNTVAKLTVDGIDNKAVAIIFSPGGPLAAQSRASFTDITQFLDGTNNDGDKTFQSFGVGNGFNDKLILVSHAELFSLVSNRVLGEIRGGSTQGLASYYADPVNSMTYPYADDNDDGDADTDVFLGSPSYSGDPDNLFFNATTKNMLENNGWFPLITYGLSPNKKSVNLTLNGKTMVVTPL